MAMKFIYKKAEQNQKKSQHFGYCILLWGEAYMSATLMDTCGKAEGKRTGEQVGWEELEGEMGEKCGREGWTHFSCHVTNEHDRLNIETPKGVIREQGEWVKIRREQGEWVKIRREQGE